MKKFKVTLETNDLGEFSKEDAYKLLAIINTWISNFDSKSSLALGLLGVIMGFVFKGDKPILLPQLLKLLKLEEVSGYEIIVAIMIIGLHLSIIIAIIRFMIVITARINNPNKSTLKSKFFFGSICDFELDDYKNNISFMTDKDIINDLVEQIHTNSNICTIKAKNYKLGIYALFSTILFYFLCKILNLI